MFHCSASPNITVPPVGLTVEQSSSVELSCNVSGVPLPLVEWFTNSSDGLTAVTVNRNVVIESMEGENGVSSTLTLLSIQLSESGVYLCMANNSLGFDTAQAQVYVFGKVSLFLCISSFIPFLCSTGFSDHISWRY